MMISHSNRCLLRFWCNVMKTHIKIIYLTNIMSMFFFIITGIYYHVYLRSISLKLLLFIEYVMEMKYINMPYFI